ncbi:MAG TPA: LPXTG cell wall anchor domain-containing protein [Cyclobacteriaceae bacterium]|nr:LPXTG cell wall anchor domain-containing protein [Cyclobacteriaceae bacterium]
MVRFVEDIESGESVAAPKIKETLTRPQVEPVKVIQPVTTLIKTVQPAPILTAAPVVKLIEPVKTVQPAPILTAAPVVKLIEPAVIKPAVTPAPIITPAPIVKLIEPAVIKPIVAPKPTSLIESAVIKTVQPETKKPVGKFGDFLKKAGGAILGVASLAVPGLAGLANALSPGTPKPSAPKATLTPKIETPLPQTLSPISASGQSFTATQKEGGLGSVLGLPDTSKTNNIILIVGGVIALLLLLPMLLRKRR